MRTTGRTDTTCADPASAVLDLARTSFRHNQRQSLSEWGGNERERERAPLRRLAYLDERGSILAILRRVGQHEIVIYDGIASMNVVSR